MSSPKTRHSEGTGGSISSIPQDQAAVECSLSLYPTEAVLSAAGLLMEEAHVQVEKPAAGKLLVVLRPRSESGLSAPELAERFRGELLWETLRLKIAKRTRPVREMILGKALLSAEPLGLDWGQGPAPWEDMEDLPPQDDYLADPLGIAVPWEERHADEAAGAADLEQGAVQPGRSPEDLEQKAQFSPLEEPQPESHASGNVKDESRPPIREKGRSTGSKPDDSAPAGNATHGPKEK